MADILQITTPALPRNYTSPTANVPMQESFQLANTTQVTNAQERSAQQQQDNADYTGEGALKALELVIAQNPSMTADSVQSLLTDELMNMLKTNGSISFLDELTALADEILLTADQLPADMAEQAKNSTMFNGELFDMLRTITAQSDEVVGGSEIRNAVTSFLRQLVGASSSQDVMTSISNTLKYLSDEMYASRSVSEELLNLAEKFAQPDAADNFTELKKQLAEVMKDVNGSLLLTDNMKSMLPLLTYNTSRVQTNPDSLGEAFRKIIDSLAGNDDVQQLLSDAFVKYVENSDLPDAVKSALLGHETGDVGASAAEELAEAVKSLSAEINPEALKAVLTEIDADNGIISLKDMLSEVIPEKADAALDKMLDSFAESKDLNKLVEHLSKIINSIPNEEIKLPLAQKLNEALENLLKNDGEIKYEKPTAMESFTNFLMKNIGDNALKTIQSFDKQNLMSSLLTAPGVYTPLLHFLVPLQDDGNKAFGELWIDNNTDGGNGGGDESDSFHILLDFSVEDVGDFELEMATKNSDMTVSLLCPESFSKSFGSIKTAISRLAAGKGFSVKNSNIGVLVERRTLTQVFPRIAERRSGLNVTA